MGVRAGDSEDAAHLTNSNLEKEVIVKHKLQHRISRTCGVLMGLIVLCSGDFSLMTEAEAFNRVQQHWRPTINPEIPRSSSPGNIPQPGSPYYDLLKKLREANKVVARPNKSIEIQEFINRNKNVSDFTLSRGSKALPEGSGKIQPGYPYQGSRDPNPVLSPQGSSFLETKKREYKEQGLARTFKEIFGLDPSASELKAMVVDDLPDWYRK